MDESTAAKAARVVVGLATIESMCAAARLRGQYAEVDGRTLAFEIREVLERVFSDAVDVSSALVNARIVTLRVIE